MKIAQVNVYFRPFMVGGAEWYVYNLSRELVRRGHEVHVFTAGSYGGETAPEAESIEGIEVHRLRFKMDWSYRMKVWRGLREALESQMFDVIHTYDYAQPHSAVAVKSGTNSHTPTVVTVFDIHSMIPRVWYRQIPMKLMEGYLAKRTLGTASRILVRAPNLVEPLVELGAPLDRIRVTPSGVRDESLSAFDGAAFRKRHSISGAPVILFVGRLNPLKGPQYLIESAPEIIRRFSEAQFVFVGPDQAGYGKVLKSMADRAGIGSNVHFLGPIYDFIEKMEAYASCDVFALPTSYEGTSQSIFEAMAQGRPVVATNVGGVPTQLTDRVEGRLVTYADARELGDAIIEILGDEGMRSTMGGRAKARASLQRYSLLTSDIERIYQESIVRN